MFIIDDLENAKTGFRLLFLFFFPKEKSSNNDHKWFSWEMIRGNIMKMYNVGKKIKIVVMHGFPLLATSSQ